MDDVILPMSAARPRNLDVLKLYRHGLSAEQLLLLRMWETLDRDTRSYVLDSYQDEIGVPGATIRLLYDEDA